MYFILYIMFNYICILNISKLFTAAVYKKFTNNNVDAYNRMCYILRYQIEKMIINYIKQKYYSKSLILIMILFL